jgi:hypothetical protein
MKTPQPTGLHMVKSSSEKVRKIFSRKYQALSDDVDGANRIPGSSRLDQVWKDYLRDLGVEYIWKFGDWSDPVDHLIEYLSSSPWNGYVIRDPSHNGQFICVPRDLGDKILVLGALP